MSAGGGVDKPFCLRADNRGLILVEGHRACAIYPPDEYNFKHTSVTFGPETFAVLYSKDNKRVHSYILLHQLLLRGDIPPSEAILDLQVPVKQWNENREGERYDIKGVQAMVSGTFPAYPFKGPAFIRVRFDGAFKFVVEKLDKTEYATLGNKKRLVLVFMGSSKYKLKTAALGGLPWNTVAVFLRGNGVKSALTELGERVAYSSEYNNDERSVAEFWKMHIRVDVPKDDDIQASAHGEI